MQLDALVLRLRAGTQAESADLGARLCQYSTRWIYPCYALAFVPLFALTLASVEIARWLPPLLLWWSKPWLDRTLLFVLSRAAFGVPTRLRDLWAAQRQVWWQQFVRSWTLRRLSLSRAFTQPVYQLEQLRGGTRARRLRQLRAGHLASSRLLTGVYSLAENALCVAVIAIALWFTPAGYAWTHVLEALFERSGTGSVTALTLIYGLVIYFLEPFYVAAGFSMYLGRRVELEAWDIEQELRRAFAP